MKNLFCSHHIRVLHKIILLTIVPLFFSCTSLSGKNTVSPCEISGSASLWAYDSCLFKHETDDALNPLVMSCMEGQQVLIEQKGECEAKRIFKAAICTHINPDAEVEKKKCMQSDTPLGSSVRNGGI